MLLVLGIAAWSLVSFAYFAFAYLLIGMIVQGLHRAWNGNILKLNPDDTHLSWGWSKTPTSQEKVTLRSIAVVNVSWGDGESSPSMEVVTHQGDYLKIHVAFAATHTQELIEALALRGVPINDPGSP